MTDDWQDTNISNSTNTKESIRLFVILRDSLAEMEKLASALEAYLVSRHDAATPQGDRD